jgi:hypothetical protein
MGEGDGMGVKKRLTRNRYLDILKRLLQEYCVPYRN